MSQWFERCANVLMVPDQTIDGALQGAVGLAGLLGFEYCGYTLETILPVSAPRSLFLNNLEGELLTTAEAYRARTVMPPSLHARRSSELLLWPLDGEDQGTDLFWRDIRRLGVRAGWTLAASTRTDAIGRFTALRTSGPFGLDEATTELPRWKVLTDMMDCVVRKLAYRTMLVNDTVALTRAELEVLAWAADGDTSKETARRMNATERHVNYLRRSAIAKLGGNNINDSAFKAFALGLLTRPVEPL